METNNIGAGGYCNVSLLLTICRERERELERERDATSQETESPLELFERAVALAGVLTANINGMEQLSLSTGAFVLALETQCGLSAEKLPQALVYVMGMYLGKLDPAIVAKLVKANDTWALSRERFARVAECLSKNTYMQPNTVAHLQMDDSNKGDTDLTCLPTTVRMGPVGQEVVRPRALLQLEALTKKSTASTRVAESIVEQLGAEGAARILGGTTDAFGAATAAMKAVLHEFDRLAAEHPNGLQIPSDRVPGVFYDLSAPIRELRSFLCHMHNSERMYVPMQTSLLGQPGLEHQGHTAQQMYSLNNSMKKQHGFFDTLDLLSVGGNVEDLKKLDCAARKLMGKPALARWTTLGRSARQWVTKLAVPGALPIQNHVMGLLGGPNSAKWLDLCRFGTCIGSNELSHLVLVLAGLAHSSTPQAAEQCWTTLGTCCAPVHRIAAVMSSGIYDLQMEDVTFADGKSGTHAATAISTRATEVVEADRRSAFKLHGLRDHWPTRLPQAYQYLLAESARAVELGLCQRPDEYVELFNNLMKKGTAGIPEATDKYLVAPYCRPGLLPLHFCCPATVRYCAAALLDALSEDGFVAAPLPAPPDPNLQVYPQLTGGQLQQKIRAGLTNAEQRQAVYRAYQLSHPEFVKELLRLVADPRAQPCAANNVPMTCFDPSDTTTQKQWWVYLDTDYRLAPELITKLFSCMSITSTAAEQYFSTATHISETNATPASNASALHFFHNVRKASEEYTMEALGKKAAALESSIRPRQGRSLEGRVARSNGLHEVIADMTTNEPHLVYPTVSNLRPPEGKRRARVQENYNANLEVMAQNAAKKSKSIEYGSVEKLVEDMSAAKISGAKKIQLTPTPELVAQKMTKAQLIARMVELRAVQEKDAAGLQRRLHGELVAMLLAFQQQPVEPIDSEGEQEPEAVAET